MTIGQVPIKDIYLNLDSNDDIIATLQGIRMPREDPEAMERASELSRSARLSRADGGKGGGRGWTCGRLQRRPS